MDTTFQAHPVPGESRPADANGFFSTTGPLNGRSSTWPPLFERLIYYLLVPELFARIVLEAGLNISPLAITQPKLWVFYALVSVEYVVSSVSLGQRKFILNISNFAVLLLLTMTIHGLIVALYWQNPLPKMFTDTVPVLVTALNIALLNSANAFRGFDFNRLARRVFIYSFVMVVVGEAASLAGRSALVNLGGSGGEPICMTIILVHLARKKIPTALDLAYVAFVLGPTVPATNRTTIAAFIVAFSIFVLPHIFRSGRQLYFSVFLFGALVGAFIAFVPADSMISRRVTGLIDHVTSEKEEDSGSLYERKAEWLAIKEKLAYLGPSAQFFGYGPGGTYTVVFSGGFVPQNYSHAHYSWSLFMLRYGYVGFLYLGLFASLLVINLCLHLFRRDALSQTVAILDMWSIIYLGTYVFFNFLAAGLQFTVTDRDQRE